MDLQLTMRVILIAEGGMWFDPRKQRVQLDDVVSFLEIRHESLGNLNKSNYCTSTGYKVALDRN
jgi:hypothetical protein